MKKIALSFSLLCLTCSSLVMAQNPEAAPAPQDAQAQTVDNSAIQIVNRTQILGQWGMEIPNNKQCVEYYNFAANNQLLIKSAQEWSVGQYQYQLPATLNEQAPTLVMYIQYDNNQKDCSGSQEDQTGEVQKLFVKWINPQKIEFCGTEKGEQCFAVLNKTLP